MKSEKISVIIPVYNVGKYIKRNVESLLRQKYLNFEAIYIDDGSTDDSLAILREYAREDSRIKVVHLENGGVSHARNAGINLATGKYIMFIDGDDYVDDDYLEYLQSLIGRDNSKMAISLGHFVNDESKQPSKIVYEQRDSVKIITDIYLNRIYMAIWNKIYDRDFLEKNNIKFDETLWYAEGMHFNIQCLSRTKKVAVGNKKVYHYVSNPDSAMRKGFKLENEKCALRSLDLQRNILRSNGVKCRALEYHYMMVSYMICKGILSDTPSLRGKEEAKKTVGDAVREIRKRMFVPLLVGLTLKNKILWFCIGVFPMYMVKRDLRKNKKDSDN